MHFLFRKQISSNTLTCFRNMRFVYTYKVSELIVCWNNNHYSSTWLLVLKMSANRTLAFLMYSISVCQFENINIWSNQIYARENLVSVYSVHKWRFHTLNKIKTNNKNPFSYQYPASRQVHNPFSINAINDTLFWFRNMRLKTFFWFRSMRLQDDKATSTVVGTRSQKIATQSITVV